MKLTDDDKAALLAIYSELPVILRILDAGVAKHERALLDAPTDDKEAIHQARVKLEGARSLRHYYKGTVLELSKKGK